MKKYGLVFMSLMVMVFTGAAQTRNSSPPGMSQATGQYYEVLFEGGSADAQLLSRELDSRFQLYNKFFHFNSQDLGGKLKVRAYKDQQAYDTYITERLDKTSPGAVYLHYNQPERRELVIHWGSLEEERMFPHQVFVQYLRAFIPYPPSWFREGFAIYFSTLKFEVVQAPAGTGARGTPAPVTGGLVYEENLAWLEAVKSLGNKAPSLEAVLLADAKGTYPDNFQGVSWALISLLKDSGKGDYARILYESFIKLNSYGSAQENSQVLYDHIKGWIDLATLDRDYKVYLNSRKTFADLIADGQRAYNVKDAKSAEEAFSAAQKQRPNHYAPYYYLGLLAYDWKNYDQAEQYYRSAQQYGADPALITYALGINAAAAGRNADAIRFLEQAKAASPDQYTEQVDNLIRRLR